MEEGMIQLFGPPAVVVQGEDRLAAMPAKGLALIGYLGMEGGSHRRATVAAMLWPDASESRRRGSLRTLLYELKNIVPGLLDVERQTVALAERTPYEIDLLQVRRLIRQESKQALWAAAGYLQGPFLKELFLDDAGTFEGWLRSAQEYWQVRGVEILQQAAAELLDAGRLQEARRTLEQLLRFQPWHEETHRRLMRLLAAEGEYAAALYQYERLVEVLAEELDLVPDARSVDLRHRIRQLRARPARNLPRQPTPFVGRERATARVQSLLASREHRLLSILGPGGIGKTRLALRAAERSRHLFLDGVYFVSLAGVKRSDSFYTPVAHALDLQSIKEGDIKAALIDHLRRHEVLLILDNFEHLVDQAGGLAEILQAAEGVQLLVTSRQALGVRWETKYRLDGLPTPAEDDPQPLAYASSRLFVSAARRADPDFQAEAHAQTIGRICREVDGTPLGIELAAALVGESGPEAIAEEIAHNLEALATTFRDVPQRQRSMRAVFDYSWALLTTAEQRDLSRLAFFRGGFTPEAARAVAGCPRTILIRLTAKSLLSEGDGRYDFHGLIRRFGREKLGATEAAAIAEKHAAYFAGEMAETTSQMVGFSQPAMIGRIRTDFADFRAAWDFALQEGKKDQLPPLLEGLVRYFDLTSLFRDGEALLEESEALLTDGEGTVAAVIRAAVRTARARFYNKQSRFEEAIAIVREIAENGAYPAGTRAAAYLEWGWALWHTGRFQEAEAPLAQGKRVALRAEAPLLVANILRNLGIVAWYQSQFDVARAHTQEAYKVHQGIGDLQGLADALNNLALIAGDEGDYRASLDLLRRAIEIKEEVGDRNGSAISLGNLGTLHVFLGMYDEAEATLDAAIALSEEVGNVENVGHSRINRCGLYVLQGRYEEAKVEAEESVQLARRLGDRHVEGYVLEFWGLAHEGAGEQIEAERLFRESLALRRETGLDEMVYHALGKLTYNAMLRQEHDEAVAYVREMEALADGGAFKNVRILQTGNFNCYRALAAAGDGQAPDYLRRAVGHLESQAGKIADPELRRSFLANIEENRLIMDAKREVFVS